MNIQQRPAHLAPFDLDKELASAQYAEGMRPTVSVLVRNLVGAVMLVCPRKADEHANAFMFPQGAIERHESPRDAAARVLRQECAFTEDLLEIAQARALGISPIESSAEVTKIHHVVFLSLRKKREPILNHENRDHLYVTGPNFLWSKITGCRPPKRKLIITAVIQAVEAELLLSKRWQLNRLQDLRRYAAHH